MRAASRAHEALLAGETELRAMRDGWTGVVRLGAFASAAAALAAPALRDFADAHPGVEVTLMQLEPDAACRALIEGRLDLAITFDYNVASVASSPAIDRSAYSDDLVVVALPSTHRLARCARVDLQDLAGEPWIASTDAEVPIGPISTRAHVPNVTFVGDDFRTVLALVAAGFGATLLPQLALVEIPSGVVVRFLTGAPIKRRLHLDRLRTDAAEPVIDALAMSLRATAEGLDRTPARAGPAF